MKLRDRLLDLAVDAVLRAVERRQRQPRSTTLIMRSPRTGEAWLLLHSASTGASMALRASDVTTAGAELMEDHDPIAGPATLIRLPNRHTLAVVEPIDEIRRAVATLSATDT